MATLKDVAKLACVDVSTVSRALNNTSYVHPDTKARIYAAVKELSYQPNVLARGLRQGKRHTIGVVVPKLQLTIFAEIIQGIEQEARRLGYATLICNTMENPKIEKECLNRLRNGFVDGIIIAGTGKNGRLLRDIHTGGIAVTQIVRQQEGSLSSVVADYETCGYDAVRYLAEKGCRRIGFINGPLELAPYRERYNGYKKAVQELGLTEMISHSPSLVNSFEYGYQCTQDILDQEQGIDALIVAVDVQGIGVMRALKEREIKVPDEVRVISLTGHSIGEILETTLTSMEMPATEMGEKATRMVIDEIEAPSDQKPAAQHLVFTSSLVERESS